MNIATDKNREWKIEQETINNRLHLIYLCCCNVDIDHHPEFYNEVAEKLEKIALRSTSIKKPSSTAQLSQGKPSTRTRTHTQYS